MKKETDKREGIKGLLFFSDNIAKELIIKNEKSFRV